MYKAKVVKIKVDPHPNADRLQLGYIFGTQVIVGTDIKDGDIGVFFPSDGQLSNEFLSFNNLYRHANLNKNPALTGYFGDNGRVTIEKIRGEKSEGFFCPLSCFEYTKYDTSKLKVGDEFCELNGHKICKKYYTPATKNAMRAKKPKRTQATYNLPRHFDTQQLEYNTDKFDIGDTVIVTEKLHGTSTRIGFVQVEHQNKLSWLQKLYNKLPLPNYPQSTRQYEFCVGTRNTIASNWVTKESNEWYRIELAEQINSLLKKGEVVYAEIVGYDNSGKLIMNHQKTSKLPKLAETYGDTMRYRYGCRWNEVGVPQYNMYVYRITQVNEDGFEIDLSWNQVKKRAKELGLQCVPELFSFVMKQNDDIIEIANFFCGGCSDLDYTHIAEGVVLRAEKTNGDILAFKHKSFEFKYLEGILKASDNYVDIEEAS